MKIYGKIHHHIIVNPDSVSYTVLEKKAGWCLLRRRKVCAHRGTPQGIQPQGGTGGQQGSKEDFPHHHPRGLSPAISRQKVFKRKKIPCVFTDYYFPSRYNSYLSEAQKQFCQSVLDFKDGKRNGIRFLVAGIEKLKPKPGTVVMFMPCSTQRKYWKRFKTMADYLHDEYLELVCGISYVRYTGDRESLHLQKDRGNAEPEKNYFFKEDLAGKEVLVVDDILTTGKSLQNFRKEVEADGGKVVGAIFAAETFKMPNAFWCYLEAVGWSEDDAGKYEHKPKDAVLDYPYQCRKWGIYDEEPEDID